MKGILENMEVFQSNHTEYSGSNTIVAVSSSLSLVTTGLMIILYLSRSKLRQASRGYLVMINVCDFVSSLCFLFSSLKMPFSDNAIIQRIEGYSIQFFYLASFCWAACYSLHVYLLVRCHREYQATNWRNQLIAWLLPFATTLSLLLFDWFGSHPIGECDRVWPWISDDFAHSFWFQLCFMYIPIVMIIVFNTVLYVCVGCSSRGEDNHCFILVRCFAYICVAIFAICWSVCDRIVFFVSGSHVRYGIDIISVSVPSLGFLNVCAYSVNKFFFNSFKQSNSRDSFEAGKDLLEEQIPIVRAEDIA